MTNKKSSSIKFEEWLNDKISSTPKSKIQFQHGRYLIPIGHSFVEVSENGEYLTKDSFGRNQMDLMFRNQAANHGPTYTFQQETNLKAIKPTAETVTKTFKAQAPIKKEEPEPSGMEYMIAQDKARRDLRFKWGKNFNELTKIQKELEKSGKPVDWTELAKHKSFDEYKASQAPKEEPKEKEMSATEKAMAQIMKMSQLRDRAYEFDKDIKQKDTLDKIVTPESLAQANAKPKAAKFGTAKFYDDIFEREGYNAVLSGGKSGSINPEMEARWRDWKKRKEAGENKLIDKQEPEITGKPGEKATPPPVLSAAEKRISFALPKLLQTKEDKKKVVSAELKKAFDKLQFEEKDAISQWGREKAKLDPSDPKYKELENKQRAEFQKWHKMFNPGIDVPFDMYQQQYEPETYKKAQASMAAKEKLPETATAESVAKPPEKQFEKVISQMQSAQTPKVEDTPRPASPSALAGQVQGPGPAGSGTGYQWEQNFQPNVIPTSQQTTSQRDMARFDPEIQDLLSRKKRYAQEGLSKREEEGFRSKMIQSMRQEQKMSGLRAGGALRGMEGASAAAAARRHQQAGQAARGQIERSVLEKDQAASRAGIEDYMKTLGEVKAFDASQFEADQMRKMLEDMYNKQMGAAGSGGGGGGGGSSSNLGQDAIDFAKHTTQQVFEEPSEILGTMSDTFGGRPSAILDYGSRMPVVGGLFKKTDEMLSQPMEDLWGQMDEKVFKNVLPDPVYGFAEDVIEGAGDVIGGGFDILKKGWDKINPFD